MHMESVNAGECECTGVNIHIRMHRAGIDLYSFISNGEYAVCSAGSTYACTVRCLFQLHGVNDGVNDSLGLLRKG